MRSAIFIVAALLASGATAEAGVVEDCRFAKDPNFRIARCTDAVNSGEWSDVKIGWAYVNRGAAFDDLHQHERALEDYTVALRLDRDDPDALFNRANTYCEMNRSKDAVTSYLGAVLRSERISRNLQTFLQGHGDYTGPIDGDFGRGSRAALLVWADRECAK